ncbi:si:dkey-102g19.3 [Puntigrus tetrazona]|uniref:si:dkey-102g19.3 n=1 Tax=Puntigrus tetrazona TaxID=1606681 RepID=UPI001C8A5DE0|nr:si:dkey-102g19.3 [Puntigrus tetrazona]
MKHLFTRPLKRQRWSTREWFVVTGRYRDLSEERLTITCRNRKETMQESLSWGCESWSFSTGCWRKVFSVQCCDTNACNRDAVTGFSSRIPNRQKCFTCDDESGSKVMSCWGDRQRERKRKGRQGMRVEIRLQAEARVLREHHVLLREAV